MHKLKNKKDFIKSLPNTEKEDGYIQFYIPHSNTIRSLTGELVWGWVKPEDKKKYNDLTYRGALTAILVCTPMEYEGVLEFGTEVVVRCHGVDRPTLDPEWVNEYLLQDMSYECLVCGEVLNCAYADIEETLWGHLQMEHEQLYERIQHLETPTMIEYHYEMCHDLSHKGASAYVK